ncbi:hypothetical protein [Micromonospora sp. B9E7]|uniref:hypothetical protein n=1 Tax=Micromonospora sp. B9E7 TaxID=3153574 RepID=UPI00325F3433
MIMAGAGQPVPVISGGKNHMRTRRSAIIGLGLVTALSFGVTGCNNATDRADTDTMAPTPTSQVDALDSLADAVRKLNTETFKVNSKTGLDGVEFSGVVDPTAKKVSMRMISDLGDQGMTVDFVQQGSAVYVKLAGAVQLHSFTRLPTLPDKWMHIDASNVDEGSTFSEMVDGDPAGVNDMIKAVTDVERNGELGFTGTFDITKSPGTQGNLFRRFGEKAKAVPFNAKVDDQGRLTYVFINLSAIDSGFIGGITATYSDFGVPVTIEKPATDHTVEAPTEVVKAFAETYD